MRKAAASATLADFRNVRKIIEILPAAYLLAEQVKIVRENFINIVLLFVVNNKKVCYKVGSTEHLC